jgi:membrane protein implicated in regulation of membrane protease activity
MNEERFFSWTGWALFTTSLVMWFTPYPAYPWALVGFACSILARVIRLEKRVDKISDEIVNGLMTRVNKLNNTARKLAVRNEQVSNLDP